MKDVRSLAIFDANSHGDLQIQSTAIDVRLYFVSLLRKVKVRLCCDKYGRDVI